MRRTAYRALKHSAIAILLSLTGHVLAGGPIELTQRSLPEVLRYLRDKNLNASFIVSGAVDLTGYPDVWYVRDLTIRPGGVLYLRTGDLELNVKGILSCETRDPAFASFRPDQSTAAPGKHGSPGGINQPGQPGAPGQDGLSSGNLRLVLTIPPRGVVRVALLGQSGGRGGNGGSGGPGIPGNRGRPGESGLFGCLRGGEAGTPGGPGGPGGNAGLGGNCGRGGVVTVVAPLRFPRAASYLEIDSRAAAVGDPGTPGKGGEGGRGGEGGSGSGFCGGGPPGPAGSQGNPGGVPADPRSRLCDPPRLEVTIPGARKP